MKKPDNVARIPCSLDEDFFIYWFNFTRPFHELTNREIEIVASIAKHRYLLSKVIKDDTILDKVTMSEDTRKAVMEECNITPEHFQVILSKLKKSKVLVDGRVNPKFIPNIKDDEKGVSLLFYFDFSKDVEVKKL